MRIHPVIDRDLRLMLFVDIHSSITRRNLERRTIVSDSLIDIAASIQPRGRSVLFDVVSHLGVMRVTTRPYGYIHGPSDEPDDRRSASVSTKPLCNSSLGTGLRYCWVIP